MAADLNRLNNRVVVECKYYPWVQCIRFYLFGSNIPKIYLLQFQNRLRRVSKYALQFIFQDNVCIIPKRYIISIGISCINNMVYLYVPNIIGYFRIALLVGCGFSAFSHPITTYMCYLTSQLLDFVDGVVARKLNQCSQFGAVLDMVTDRAGDAVMVAILVSLYPAYSGLFMLDIMLDLFSHWYHMYSTLFCRQLHHKTTQTDWKLLRLYYNNQSFLSVLILGNEFFYLSLYINYFKESLWSSPLLTAFNNLVMVLSFVVFMTKKIVSVVQLINACQKIVQQQKTNAAKIPVKAL